MVFDCSKNVSVIDTIRCEWCHFSVKTFSGSRIVRHMQRLRRLCGAHQQCVVYSNRELASEISSIVHAAKHLSEPGTSGSSHRRSGKVRRIALCLLQEELNAINIGMVSD